MGVGVAVGAGALTTTTGGGGIGVCVGGITTVIRGGSVARGGMSSPDWDAMMMSVTIAKNAIAPPAASSGGRFRRFGGSRSNISAGFRRYGGSRSNTRGSVGGRGPLGLPFVPGPAGSGTTGGAKSSGAAKPNMPASVAASSPGV